MSNRYGLEIRAATPGDAAALVELFAATGRRLTPDQLAEAIEAQRNAHGTALIALEWGPPSGLVVLHWYRPLCEPRAVAQITLLLVGPDHRRRGIGRMLLKAASQAARLAQCDRLEILASPEDADLQAFCHATGFAQAGGLFTRALRKGR